MDAKDAYQRTSALLDDFLDPLGMLHARGPLRAMGDLVRGILWSGSVQLSNACRIIAQSANELAYEVDRLSVQLANRKWDHREWMAATKADANQAFDLFVETYQDQYSSAVECLKKDRQRLLTFYDFPAKHWTHIRTSNPIVSIFSIVRLRHNKTRNNASRAACLAMVYKLGQSAQRNFQRLNGAEQIKDIVIGII